MWRENTDKIVKIINAVRKAAREIPNVYPPSKVNDLMSIWYSSKPSTEKLTSDKYSTYIYHVEEIKGYAIYKSMPSINEALTELENMNYSVASIDSSSHGTGGHGFIPFIIHNVGVWLRNYGSGSGYEDNFVFTSITEGLGEVTERIWMKKNEFKVIKEISKDLKGDVNFMMLDESFNIGFTMTWSSEERTKYSEVLAEYTDYLMDNNVIPLGVFYTRAVDIIRGLIVKGIINEEEFQMIQDKVLLNRLLNVGERSPIFSIYSKPHTTTNLELCCIYVKLGEYNVLRVEFPRAALKMVDHIHRVILLEGVVGEGYPYPLQASHENAVLSREIREAITEVFSEELGMIDESYLSKKEVSKRWPLA